MNQQLIDPFGRSIEYLRLSVTDRCDLRCFYCLPGDYRDFSEPEEWLTFAEIERVIRAFTVLGVRRVRVTGGEPLVRKNLATLVTQLSDIPGIEDLSLSTNAVAPYSRIDCCIADLGGERSPFRVINTPDIFMPSRGLELHGLSHG